MIAKLSLFVKYEQGYCVLNINIPEKDANALYYF